MVKIAEANYGREIGGELMHGYHGNEMEAVEIKTPSGRKTVIPPHSIIYVSEV